MSHIARTVFTVSGPDAASFLQNLVTNDVTAGPIVYAALLTPQGKFLCDFFLVNSETGFLLDVAESHAAGLMQRLNMYKLRSDVAINPSDLFVSISTSETNGKSLPDPRVPNVLFRHYGTDQSTSKNYDDIRVKHSLPETGIELTPDTYILEAGFERLNGVDFKKGCYVGQEVTARMKHKTELKKGLTQLRIAGSAQIGTNITYNGKTVGQVYSQSNGLALAHVRFDRVAEYMQAGEAVLSPL